MPAGLPACLYFFSSGRLLPAQLLACLLIYLPARLTAYPLARLLTNSLVCLPASLPDCFPSSRLLTFLQARLTSCLLTFSLTRLPASLFDCLSTCLPAHLLACSPSRQHTQLSI